MDRLWLIRGKSSILLTLATMRLILRVLLKRTHELTQTCQPNTRSCRRTRLFFVQASTQWTQTFTRRSLDKLSSRDKLAILWTSRGITWYTPTLKKTEAPASRDTSEQPTSRMAMSYWIDRTQAIVICRTSRAMLPKVQAKSAIKRAKNKTLGWVGILTFWILTRIRFSRVHNSFWILKIMVHSNRLWPYQINQKTARRAKASTWPQQAIITKQARLAPKSCMQRTPSVQVTPPCCPSSMLRVVVAILWFKAPIKSRLSNCPKNS